MQQYLELLEKVLLEGDKKCDRTGTGTISLFGSQMRFDLKKGFPLITTKKLHLKSIVHELLWFLKGDTNIKYLKDNNIKIWDEWADKNGELGPIYGNQWRSWLAPSGKIIDQIEQIIDQLKNNPDSRRIIVSAWNVGEIDKMALPPCHLLFQFYTRELRYEERINLLKDFNTVTDPYISVDSLDKLGVPERAISCQLYQRSADMFLGVPFNIASYSLLIYMVANQCNMVPDEFIWTGGDIHIYLNHIEQVKTQLSRDVRSLPRLLIKNKPETIDDYHYEDFEFLDYNPHPHIKGDVSI